MVIFAITREGFLQVEPLVRSGTCILWVGDGVLTQEEITDLRGREVEVTNFSYSISPESKEEIDDALQTISEHHPNTRVWMEIQT